MIIAGDTFYLEEKEYFCMCVGSSMALRQQIQRPPQLRHGYGEVIFC
jgi:hypothetical protein